MKTRKNILSKYVHTQDIDPVPENLVYIFRIELISSVIAQHLQQAGSSALRKTRNSKHKKSKMFGLQGSQESETEKFGFIVYHNPAHTNEGKVFRMS